MKTREHVYAISTNNLWTAIADATDILSDLLEEFQRTGSESDGQSAIELQRALARYREQWPQLGKQDSFDSDDDDDDGMEELVE